MIKGNKAQIKILVNGQEKASVSFDFNPAEYSLDYGNRFQITNLPGFEYPLIQFVSGEGETLQMDLLFDTSMDNPPGDVRQKLKKLLQAVQIDPELHAPPICEFSWGSVSFKAVIEKLSQRYILFREDGVPVRAKINISLRRYLPPEEQQRRKSKSSSDVTKRRILIEGDNIFLLAWREYGDPGAWRHIALANGLKNPLEIKPGTVLILPPWEGQKT